MKVPTSLPLACSAGAPLTRFRLPSPGGTNPEERTPRLSRLSRCRMQAQAGSGRVLGPRAEFYTF